jgi:uncharacterized protein with GYD domain
MHFCMTAQYTPKSLNAILENPKTNRYEAAKKMVEAAGGKLISMYSTAANGPGVLVIFDVPDPNAASAMSGVVIASGAVHNVNLTRLWTPDEVTQVRQKGSPDQEFVHASRRLASDDSQGCFAGRLSVAAIKNWWQTMTCHQFVTQPSSINA